MATLLLMSFLALSSVGTGAANAQSNDDCTKLPIHSVVANNEYKEYVATNAVDKDPNTTWSHYGLGSYIQADLGESSALCSVDIQWYNGVAYNFVISVSEDGTNFRAVTSGVSTGQALSSERYNIPDTNSRFVRITVNGNNDNNWADIAELAINGRTCTVPQIVGVTATGNDGNIPENTLDNNPNTRWSAFGLGSLIEYTFSKSELVCEVDVSWYKGDQRVNTFTIWVSNDGENWQNIFSGKSTGRTVAFEPYNIPDVMAKYVSIEVTGNTQNDWVSISEVAINPGASTSPVECKPPVIAAIGATGSQAPNVPQNTIDNDLTTRWSNLGPSSIEFELGNSQPVCKVDISWYRGNSRVNTFEISASNDKKSYQTIFSGTSNGMKITPESYDVKEDTFAKYIRVTVTGNTENSWVSISEIGINGGIQGSPSQEICGNGVDDDLDGKVDEGCSSDGGEDDFGIEKIYPTKSEGEEWFMDMTDGKDPRSKPPSMTKNSDGSFKVKSSKVRYGVFTTSGYNPDEIETLNHGTIAEKGYMQSPNDWRDVEMTGYVKMNNGDSGENFAFYARGGRHTGSGDPEGCEGSAYKGDLGYDGRVRFAKEQWHVSYVFTDHKKAMSSIEDKWVGLKSIMYNMEQDGKTVAKMEIWLDKNEDGKQDGPWVKVDENIDDGGWGNADRECGGDPDQIIIWGGPVATFRWDGATDVDIKNFSVREIQSPSQ